jgi:Kef-type K+ transport system membrane component KefB
MRRVIVLVLLYLLMQAVLPLGEGTPAALVLMAFGFLILGAYSVGELAASIRLPKIVGYLAAGLAVGPAVLNFVSAPVMTQLAPVSQLAIALIAFLAGAELQLDEVRARGTLLLKLMTAELTVSFLGIVVVLVSLHGFLPALEGAPLPEVLGFSILFASVAVVHSPAVTMALLSESGAKGVVARTTLGVVLLADVAVVLSFSGALALVRVLVPPSGGGSLGVLTVLWEIGGAILVGTALGAVVALYLRFIRRELFIFAILVAFFGSEIARLMHVETLLTLLMAGFVAENAGGGEGEQLRHAMERAGAPIFVVFFALAGAQIKPAAVMALWPLALPLVLVRAGGIWAGSQLGARWAGAEPEAAKYMWMGLISQAGVAIGLASVMASVYPERGEELQTLFLATLTVNQTLGPIMFRFALLRSGEATAESARKLGGGKDGGAH